MARPWIAARDDFGPATQVARQLHDDQRLRKRGYEVFAVNPNADEIGGDKCYHDLRSIPGGVGAVGIGTKPETAEATMRECADLGIKHGRAGVSEA
jgi:predicted CoA-binding protein